jgi:hypothetical protein
VYIVRNLGASCTARHGFASFDSEIFFSTLPSNSSTLACNALLIFLATSFTSRRSTVGSLYTSSLQMMIPACEFFNFAETFAATFTPPS